jgi:allantoinase
MDQSFDLVIKNARVVRPNKTSVDCLDIAIAGGRIARLAPDIQAALAKEVFDAKNFLAFPGCVDAHMHVGIYQPLTQDAGSESKAAAIGGVTSSLNYIRTGQYYLNRGGPYRDFMPEALKQSDGRFWVDYGYHIAPIEGRISKRWSTSPSTTASPRSRYSCSTAGTACTAGRATRTSS